MYSITFIRIIKICIFTTLLQPSLKTNPQKNMKPTNNNKKPTGQKGFGFADAMFGLKDMAMTYQDLQGGPVQPQPQIPKPTITTTAPNTKINIIKKQTIADKKQTNGPKQKQKQKQKIEMHHDKNKEIFRVSAGKQFENFKSAQLIPLETSPDVYELTLEGKQSHWEYNVFCDGIQAKMIVPEPEVSFNFQATDVKQGGLGNCYFIATLASLAHFPKLLRQRIPKCKSYSGKDKSYQVNLFESGKSLKIIVDNLFPKVFAKPVNNDISLMVLEKAYAQAYGNFQIINMGHSCDSLRDLSGAPTQYIDLKDKTKLILQLSQAFAKKQPIVIASKSSTKMQFLSPKHSFNILDYQVPQNNSNIFLKLRDPRGCNCSDFPIVKHISEEQILNGIFWVDYKMLVENFQVITVCRVKVGNKYLYKSYQNKEISNGQVSMMMKVKEKAQFVITAHQKHKKFFDDKYHYKMVRILIAKIDCKNGKINPQKVISSDFKTQQVCSITCQLPPGQYLILSKIGTLSPTLPQSQQPHLTLSFYTNIQNAAFVSFNSILGQVPISDLIISYMKTHLEQFKESISQKKLERYFGAFYGYICMLYQNCSGKSVVEDLEYDVENVRIGDKRVMLSPGETKLLLHEIGQLNNCSHKFAFKTKTIYKS